MCSNAIVLLRIEVLYFILLACFGPLWAATPRVSLSCLPWEQAFDGLVEGDWSSVLHEPRCRNRVRHFHGSHWKGQEFEHDKNVSVQFLCKLDVLVIVLIVALEPDSSWYEDIAMKTLCQVTSRKKRVFSSNLQTFITVAWQLISVRQCLTIRMFDTSMLAAWNSQWRQVKVWNATVANLTLMALGSSAPEILLSVRRTQQEDRTVFLRGSFQILSCRWGHRIVEEQHVLRRFGAVNHCLGLSPSVILMQRFLT